MQPSANGGWPRLRGCVRRQSARTLVPDPRGTHKRACERKRHAPLPQSSGIHRPHRSAGEMCLVGTPTWGRHVPCQPQAMGDKSFRLGRRAPRCHEERRTRSQRRTWGHETDGDEAPVVPTGATHTRVSHARSNRAPVVHSVIQHVPGSAPAWIVSFSTGGERRCPKGG